MKRMLLLSTRMPFKCENDMKFPSSRTWCVNFRRHSTIVMMSFHIIFTTCSYAYHCGRLWSVFWLATT